MGETAEAFVQRARMEAARYGSDPWVFVRELLQNARDAGAGQVRFTVDRSGGFERITCRDDGSGMTFEHAREFLFTLYASSKAGDPTTAGRFGIGFWSVLRFNPSRIIVRSRPRDDNGWEVAVDGEFRSARQKMLVMQPGTEIILERRATEEDLESRIASAIQADVRYLMRRDDPDDPVQLHINDQPFLPDRDLAPPSLAVVEPDLRIEVALGDTPTAEVFAHGIRVRSASFLHELLTEGAADGPASVALPDGLLPRVVMDSARLEVLLARGDARQDRTLSSLVRRAERELAVLIERELDAIAPRPVITRLWDRLKGGGWSRWWAVAVAAAGGAVLAGLILTDKVGVPWADTAPVGRTPRRRCRRPPNARRRTQRRPSRTGTSPGPMRVPGSMRSPHRYRST